MTSQKHKESHYICLSCGELSTFSEQLEAVGNGEI